MNNALAVQEGGDHYKNKAIQPVEFGMANRLDCCAFSILKYVTRFREKAGELDLRKAYHFVELREKLAMGWRPLNRPWSITMLEYCDANAIAPAERVILMHLSEYVFSNDRLYADWMKTEITALIAATYSTKE